MIPLLVGTGLALGALAFVLAPLFSNVAEVGSAGEARDRETSRRAREEEARAVEALREIEFDRATGKLAETDYRELKAAYTLQAVEAMRHATEAGLAVSRPNLSESAPVTGSLRAPECASCGPRPERFAIYCSECGRLLDRRCAHCGAEAAETGARFCSACGHRLAA